MNQEVWKVYGKPCESQQRWPHASAVTVMVTSPPGPIARAGTSMVHGSASPRPRMQPSAVHPRSYASAKPSPGSGWGIGTAPGKMVRRPAGTSSAGRVRCGPYTTSVAWSGAVVVTVAVGSPPAVNTTVTSASGSLISPAQPSRSVVAQASMVPSRRWLKTGAPAKPCRPTRALTTAHPGELTPHAPSSPAEQPAAAAAAAATAATAHPSRTRRRPMPEYTPAPRCEQRPADRPRQPGHPSAPPPTIVVVGTRR